MESATKANSAFPDDLKVTELPENLGSDQWFFARAFGVNNAVEVLEALGQADASLKEDLESVIGILKVCELPEPAVTKRSACVTFLKQSSGAAVKEVDLQVLGAKSLLETLASANCSTAEGRGTVAAVELKIANTTNANASDQACDVVKNALNDGITADTKAGESLVTLLWPGAVNLAVENVINGTDSAKRIELCKADDEDKAIFEAAQKMIPAAIALAGLGMLVSFAAIGTNKKVLAIVGGLFAVLGGGVLLAALLYVRTAPVYALVSEAGSIDDATPGSAYYKPGLAQTLALGAIAGPILGGFLVLGSSFCGPSEEESQALSGKVDGTY